MKVVYFTLLFTILVVVQGKKHNCATSDDCENGCCILKGLYRRGICKPLAKAGNRCSDTDAEMEFLGHKKYLKDCPCESGLSCESKRVRNTLNIKLNIKINPRCVSTGEPETETTPVVIEETEVPREDNEETEAPPEDDDETEASSEDSQ